MKRFKGIFNWYSEIVILETMAENDSIAKNNMFHQLSSKTKMNVKFIHQYYRTRPAGYKITEQKVAQDLVN